MSSIMMIGKPGNVGDLGNVRDLSVKNLVGENYLATCSNNLPWMV